MVNAFHADGNVMEKMTAMINQMKILICVVHGIFNKFPDFFVQAFKIVVDSWKFSILLLYI